MLQIEQFMCLSDNFGVLIHDPESGRTASVDAPEAAAIVDRLEAKGWTLTDIMTTHHHHDHVGGNLELKERFGCRITGPKGEADKIPGIDEAVGEGDVFSFGAFDFEVIETPGHTAGHIVYYSPKAGLLFAGDTLFSMGCGRLFERGAAEMWSGLSKLKALPAETMLYCGHEYTLANARFALSVDPDNQALQARLQRLKMILKGRFGHWNATNLAALDRLDGFLTPDARQVRDRFAAARQGNAWARLKALRKAGVYRQSRRGTAALYTACLLRRL